MKNTLALLLILSGFAAQAQKAFILTIDGKEHEVQIDKAHNLKVNGKSVEVLLSAKETQRFDHALFSFEYSKDYKIASTAVDVGIDQIMLMTAEGSGFLIQMYSGFNPTMLNEMMLSEVTKESINYGFKMGREDYKRELISGQDLEVSKAVLTYKDEKNTYEVATIGNKDEGILIMTMITVEEYSEKGKKMINQMWNSLEYK